jgi:hypothetical protein
MKQTAILLVAAASIAVALVQAYSVAPKTAAMSGWTGRGDTVSEVVTCNFDSLVYVELFAGDKGNPS